MHHHHLDTPAEYGLALPEQPVTPTAIVPAAEREPMVYVPGPGNAFVAVPRSTALAYGYLAQQPAHLPATPVPAGPAVDPLAQRMVAAGVGGGVATAGIGWGIGQALAGGGVSLALLVAALLVARFAGRRGGAGGGSETHIHVTNNNRWLGRSSTTTRL